ncbi:MAG: hypothetical protein QM811_28925 [Pirellulales bacterium]
MGYKFTAPETGTYRVLVRDLYFQTRGNAQYVYRLILRNPTPDFRVMATVDGLRSAQNANIIPSFAPVLQQGGTQGVRVYVSRQDEFKGDVRLTVEGLPPGVTCSETVVGGDANFGVLVFSAAEKASAWSGVIRIVGKAKIGDREVAHVASAATIVWGTANRDQNPVRTRVSSDVALSVIEGETQPFVIEVGDGKPVATSLAGKLEIPVKVVRRGDFKEPLKLTGVALPKDIKFVDLNIPADKTEGKLVLDIKNTAAPGTYTFALQSQGKLNAYRKNPSAAERWEKSKVETDKAATDAAEKVKQATAGKATADKAVADATAAAGAADKAVAAAKAEATAAAAKRQPAADKQQQGRRRWPRKAKTKR